jgi:hypothetical protein
VKTLTLIFIAALVGLSSITTTYGQSTGRVVINEYLPWTSNGCGATGEFVELLNFGPGPVNIGCHIITDGDFSVTIPPNTILQPGQFYLIAGQNIIPSPCANVDSTVTADLNWTTCGCTSGSIPITGDGFFTDGGSANEQVVLLDPTGKVLDAVIRSFPAETSSLITTSGIGGCTPLTFDLDDMNINYEVLGMSAGRANSFARFKDGDCEWVKETQQSGDATNNKPGETSSLRYSFSIIESMDCDSKGGSIDIYVNIGSNTDVFPMQYILVFDSNNNGVFDLNDTYTHGIDNTPSSVEILGLPLGNYRITVSSAKGCFLQTFDFRILDCTGVLPVGVSSFRLSHTNSTSHTFKWSVSDLETIKKVVLERTADGINYTPLAEIPTASLSGSRHFTQMVPAEDGQYRVKLVYKNGQIAYSTIIHAGTARPLTKLSPNPARDNVIISFDGEKDKMSYYKIYDLSGAVVAEGKHLSVHGTNQLQVPLTQLRPGVYHLSFVSDKDAQPISFRIVKQ